MLNVYKKFERPEELNDYETLYPLAEALRKLRNHESDTDPDYELTDRDKEILSKNTKIILRYPILAYNYAQNVLNGRWPECETIIKDNERLAYCYAAYVSHVRWKDIGYPEVEKMFLQNVSKAYAYVDAVVKGRWPEAEPLLITDPITACYYAIKFMKHRWLEAEDTIREKPDMWNKYKDHFGIE